MVADPCGKVWIPYISLCMFNKTTCVKLIYTRNYFHSGYVYLQRNDKIKRQERLYTMLAIYLLASHSLCQKAERRSQHVTDTYHNIHTIDRNYYAFSYTGVHSRSLDSCMKR